MKMFSDQAGTTMNGTAVARFSREARALPVNPGGHVGRPDLDDDSPVQGYFQCEKYTAHAAATHFFEEAVVVADGCLKASKSSAKKCSELEIA